MALAAAPEIDLTRSGIGYIATRNFHRRLHVGHGRRKAPHAQVENRCSLPPVLSSGYFIGAVYTQQGMQDAAETAFRHTLLEFAELMLFLLVAMTYINALEERRLFDALRAWMIRKGFSYRSLFWIDRGSLLLNFPYRRQLNHRITDVRPWS